MENCDFLKWSEDVYFSDHRDEKLETENIKLLFNSKSSIFVDIGASIGEYTYFVNKYLQNGIIYCIEPDPRRYKLLKEHCEKWANRSGNQIHPIQTIVSEVNSTVKFYTSNANTSGGLFIHDNLRTRNDVDAIFIESITLDAFFNKKRYPDLVKIDVEGAELLVLTGANNILSEGKTVFLIEIHSFSDPEGKIRSVPDDVFNLMHKYHYNHLSFFSHTLFFNKMVPWKFLVFFPISKLIVLKNKLLKLTQKKSQFK